MDKPRMPQVGETLGAYRLDEELARSGMDVSFKGFDTTLDRAVAVKVLAPELAAIPTAVVRFKNVARSLANLNHPNCLKIYATGEQTGVSYLATELVAGATVAELALHHSPFDPRQTAKLLRQAALGLQHAAQQQIFHGDLLPADLLITAGGMLKVTDFDLATQLAREVEPHQFTEFFGTPQYLSPEVAAGRLGDQRSDIYSLGAIAYHLLTGSPPFIADTIAAVSEQQKSQTPTPVTELNPQVPSELAGLVAQMLAVNPKDRPQKYDALIAALDEFLHPAPPPPPPPPVQPRTPAIPVPGRPFSRPAPAPPQQPRLQRDTPPPPPAPAPGTFAPGDRPLARRPLPATAPAKKSSLGMIVGVGVSLLLIGGGIYLYYKTAPENVRNGSFLTVTVDQPAPPPPPPPVAPPKQLSKQERAEADYKMVKAMADSLIARSDWIEAWKLYDQFMRSPVYRGTTVGATADAERQRILKLVETSWEAAQKQIRQLVADGKYDDALSLCDKFTAAGRELPTVGAGSAEEALAALTAKLSAATDATTEWKDIARGIADKNWEFAVTRTRLLRDRTENPFVKAHEADLQRLYDLLFAKPSTQSDAKPESPADAKPDSKPDSKPEPKPEQ